ncbi:MAG: endonuclease VIII [Deltaproteobacteria bacterium]|nr:endonuclease VIII [Deltaproteobacteria bacterium]
MPEGPEIAREADQIRAAVLDKRVERVHFGLPHLSRREAAFEDARVVSVRPRGKAMLIGFDNGLTLYSHNQLYGRWYVRKAGSLPKTRRQLRMAIETQDRWALLYSASEIDVLDEVGLSMHPYLAKLGPDVLDPTLEAATISARLEDRRFQRRGLGALLLDQSFVAGLGNYLRSEIAFEARLHPDQRPLDLDPADRRRLARATLKMARRAYETKGVTLPRSQAAALRRAGQSWSRARHWVFARARQSCRRCDDTIVRFDLAGRRIYVCPTCQVLR